MTPAEALASGDPALIRRARRTISDRHGTARWTMERALHTPMGGRMKAMGGAVSPVTPWEEDDVCWYVVTCHPDGLTLDEIGELLGGISKERVRQIEEVALRKFAALLALEGVKEADAIAWLSRGKAGDDPDLSGTVRSESDARGALGRALDARIAAQEPSEQTMRAEAAIAALEAAAERVEAASALADVEAVCVAMEAA